MVKQLLLMVEDLINRYNVIIPAAGSARRLRPLTEKTPKSMLKVGNLSIIERQLINLPKENINKVVIIAGHESGKLINFVEKLNFDFPISFVKNNEYDKTNCAQSLMCASEFFQDIIIINCDLLFSIESIQKLINNDKSAAVCYRDNKIYQTDLQKALIKNNHISKWSLNLNEANAEIMGPVKLNENNSLKILNYFKTLSKTDQKQKHCFSLFSECISEINFYPVKVSDNAWYEIDNKLDLNNANKLFKNSELLI